MTDYSKVPVHYMLSGLQRYVEDGVVPGSFLRAVLENDLFKAVGAADDNNVEVLKEWCMFIYNDIPANIWGSPKKVQAHIDACALKRQQANEEAAKIRTRYNPADNLGPETDHEL